MKKIVAVDDQIGQLRVLEMLFTVEHELITLKDGKEVLEYLKENTPDLIILDVNMPYMSGIDVCGRIKRIERLKKVPVIILTAERGKNLQEQAKICGADAFVPKPLTGKDFTQKVKELLELGDADSS